MTTPVNQVLEEIQPALDKLAESYVCGACGGTFEKTRSDAEAYTEAKRRWPTIDPIEKAAVICDDCHAEMLELAASEGIL